MKKFNSYILIASLVFCTISCASKQLNSIADTSLVLNVNSKKGVSVSNFLGFNSTILPYHLNDNYDSLFPIIEKLSPKILRFPGGTIANFYHPTGPGYGMNIKTMDKMKNNHMNDLIINQNKKVNDENIQVNYKVPFAKLCKQLNNSVLIVANLFDGTIAETIALIDYFNDQKIKVVGIELGNEYYLNAYKNEFPSVETYISRSKKFALEIRKQYPNLKLSVIAAPNKYSKEVSLKRKLYYEHWNSQLAKEKFYDAISAHIYVKSKECIDISNQDSLFECASKKFNFYSDKTLEKVKMEYENIYNESISIWLTEWNLRETKTHFGNTFIQAIHALDFALNTIKINSTAKTNSVIEFSIYHNLCAGGEAFALINPANANEKSNNQEFIRRASYFSLSMLQEVLTINDIQYIPTKNKLINKNLDFGLFYSVSKNELYLFLTNKTSKNIELPAIKIDNKSPNEVFLSQLKGEKLSSKMGVHISNSNSAAAEIVLKNEIIDLNTWVIPSFSINKVTFQLK